MARKTNLPLAMQNPCLYDGIDIKNMQNTMFLRSNSSDNVLQRVTSMLTPHGFRSIEGIPSSVSYEFLDPSPLSNILVFLS